MKLGFLTALLAAGGLTQESIALNTTTKKLYVGSAAMNHNNLINEIAKMRYEYEERAKRASLVGLFEKEANFRGVIRGLRLAESVLEEDRDWNKEDA
jgi:hypothetical protein